MKLIGFGQAIVIILTALMLNSNAVAQGEENSIPGVLEMEPSQTGLLDLPSTVPPKSLNTRKQACEKYAKDTVVQLKWLVKMNCGYGKNSFESSSLLISYDLEYANCMNSNPRRMGEAEFHLSDISKNIQERQKAIADCICKPYAENARQQNNEKLLLECAFQEDGRWSSDFNYHYKWCARGGGKIIESGSWEKFYLSREKDLDECKKPFAPVNLRPDGKTIPKGFAQLFWDDPGREKAQTAEKYQLKIIINGKATHNEELTKEYFTIGNNFLNYGSSVMWQVRSKNTSGYSSWSNGSFKIVSGPPKILTFKRDPYKFSYKIGEEVTLRWNVQCPLSCSVTLYGGLNGSLFKLKNQPKSGSKMVEGLVQDTAYKLIVNSASHTVEKVISVRTRPKPNKETKVFYFKVNCPSTVRPCWVVSLTARRSSEAKQAVKNSAINCIVEEITQSEYLKGCK